MLKISELNTRISKNVNIHHGGNYSVQYNGGDCWVFVFYKVP